MILKVAIKVYNDSVTLSDLNKLHSNLFVNIFVVLRGPMEEEQYCAARGLLWFWEETAGERELDGFIGSATR